MKGARKEERGHSAETPEENTERIVVFDIENREWMVSPIVDLRKMIILRRPSFQYSNPGGYTDQCHSPVHDRVYKVGFALFVPRSHSPA